MAKEQYDISYKTYFNSRLKPVHFRGEDIFPIYVRLSTRLRNEGLPDYQPSREKE